MKDVMVSIRMPAPLVEELEARAEHYHFLDLSEQIRSIVRQKWMEQTNPELAELQSLRKNIESQVKKNAEQRISKEVVEELKRIQEQLQKGGKHE